MGEMDPNLCNGRPTVRGMRITVETILGCLEVGESIDAILEQHPGLEREDIAACLAFAGRVVGGRFELWLGPGIWRPAGSDGAACRIRSLLSLAPIDLDLEAIS